MEKDFAVGQTIQFDVIPSEPLNTTVEAYTAKYQVVGVLDMVEGVVEKSQDNTKFIVKIDTSNLKPGKYEVRVMITDTVENFTDCPVFKNIVLRK
jgi:hypothetical protein